MNATINNTICCAGFVTVGNVNPHQIIVPQTEILTESHQWNFNFCSSGFFSRNNDKETIRADKIKHGRKPKVSALIGLSLACLVEKNDGYKK